MGDCKHSFYFIFRVAIIVCVSNDGFCSDLQTLRQSYYSDDLIGDSRPNLESSDYKPQESYDFFDYLSLQNHVPKINNVNEESAVHGSISKRPFRIQVRNSSSICFTK